MYMWATCGLFILMSSSRRLRQGLAQVAQVAEAVFEQLTHTQNFYHGLGEALPMFHIKACTYLRSCNATSKLHLYHISPWMQACASACKQ